ncbi:RNA pseudouridylate synthase domain-containing protein [Rhizoctonia solani AG-1 IA]|uniref:RNA pseudouridylate synthase domain-containing protein n=1 Tax=Thanatephorus cucumeris (strain AG1-IA) TaxID=983506 RepID=L8X0Z8_THACA|nr:RNA pseudouridylate synthase domain-containing protein [Rhizoctonia solani AG-1 IA]
MDRGLIVLNKPAGLVSQGGKHTLVHRPLVQKHWTTFWTVDFITYRIPLHLFITGATDLTTSLSLKIKPLPVHRLDKATTGALILARNSQVAQTLSSQLRRPSSNAIIKTYLALVHGSFEPESNGEIRKSLFISDGRVSVQPSSVGAISKEVPTHTTWRCLFSKKGVSLMELGLKTGVKHQLRVTMRYLRKPVLGRRTYKLGIVVPPPSVFLSICQSLGFSIDHPWAPSPVRVTVDGSEIPYDPSYTLDEEIVTEFDRVILPFLMTARGNTAIAVTTWGTLSTLGVCVNYQEQLEPGSHSLHFPTPWQVMKDFEAKSLSSRILSATRSTGSAITRSIPLPGLSEVKGAAKKLVDGLEVGILLKRVLPGNWIDPRLDYRRPCSQMQDINIQNCLNIKHAGKSFSRGRGCHGVIISLHICQRQLSRIDSRRGLSGALRATRQIEVIERVEKEIGTGLQDFLFSIMLRRLSAPRQNLTIEPDETTSKNQFSYQTHHYPKIKRCQISVGTMIRRRRIDSVVKSVTRGTYRNRNILLVQYSSKEEPQKAAEPQSRLSYKSNVCSTVQDTLIIVFFQWDDIHISHDGRAVVCPPYWDDPDTWSKSNHDVFTSLTGTTHSPDFPLTTLTEILNMAGSRWSDFQLTVTTHGYGLRDYHLMQIADELELPVPPFLLIYCGPLPDFLVSVGSIGVPEWIITGQSSDCFSGSMTDWVGISSLWSCTGWEVLQTCTLEYWSVGNGPPHANEDHEDFSCGATLEPYGCFESSDSFGISYELAVSDPMLFEESWKRYSATKISNIMHMAEDEQSIQAVRHISVNIRCKFPKKRGLLPLYFHRRPSSLFNVEHYWGFLSDSPDPDVPPCRLVRDVQVEYSVEINTLRANDTWAFRAEQCFESIVSRTPGSFHAWDIMSK